MKLLSFLTLILISLNLRAEMMDVSIQNTWLLAIEGCDLGLKQEEIAALHLGKHYQDYYISILSLDGQQYLKRNFKGRLCQSENLGLAPVKKGEDLRLYCGTEVSSQGIYTAYNNQLFFMGKIIKSYGSVFETLGVENHRNSVSYKMIKGVLILEESSTRTCGKRKLISYYVPYSIS